MMRAALIVGLVLIVVLTAAHAIVENREHSPCAAVGSAPLSGDCR